MKTLKLMTIIMVCSLQFTLAATGPLQGELKAGAAKVNITPPDHMYPTGVVHKDFIGVHDSVYVRTIVIDNGITRAAIMSFELGNVPEDVAFYESLSKESGILPQNLFVSATHTHNMLSVNQFKGHTQEYYGIVKSAAIKSLKDAIARLQPAKVGYATGKAYVNTNRDQKIGEGYHMGYAPDRFSDKTVATVTFTNLAGDPIAFYVNYPCHSVLMYRATTRDGHPEVSGDLAGATSRYVEDHFKGTVAVWSNGSAGDQNPLFMATYNQDAPDVFDTGAAGYALLEVQSRRLGEEMVRLIRATKNTNHIASIRGNQKVITCPGQKRKYPADPNTPSGGYLAPAYVEMIDGDPVSIPLHLLMINDIAIAGVSGDFFAEVGWNIKQEVPFDRTILVTKMPEFENIPNISGYIATDEAYLLPAEKTVTNNLKPGCAQTAVIDAYTEMMEEYISIISPGK